MTVAGRRYVERERCWDAACAGYVAVFDRLLVGRMRPVPHYDPAAAETYVQDGQP